MCYDCVSGDGYCLGYTGFSPSAVNVHLLPQAERQSNVTSRIWMCFMNILSKIFSFKYMKFLFGLTAFLFVIDNGIAKDKETSANEDPAKEAISSIESQRKGVFSEFLESISVGEKPYKAIPGYWGEKDLNDILDENHKFNISITNIEKNAEFPSDTFSLENLKGNVVILFFTTTWCHNCTSVFKDLDCLTQDLANRQITNVKIIPLVLGIDDDQTIEKYYKKNEITSLHKFKSISPLFCNKITHVPTCFVFNKNSVPVWGFSGITNYRALEFLNFIESLVKEN